MAAVIDLRRRYEIEVTRNPNVPAAERYEARDWRTYNPDPESRWHIYGSGPCESDARIDLLEKIAELAVMCPEMSR